MNKDIIIRSVEEKDAAAYNAYRRSIADEPNNMILHSAGDYTRTVEAEEERIRGALVDPDYLMLLAEHDGNIIGTCMCRGAKGLSPTATQHSVGLGIDIAQSYRSQGIGNALMQAAVDWARTHPVISRVELEVFSINRPAISLYLKYDFVIEGLKRRAYFKDGRYVDVYLMALLLEK